MNEVIKTRKDVVDLINRLDGDITLAKKGNCIGHLFQLSMNIATYVRLNREDVSAEIPSIYNGLVGRLDLVLSLGGGIDGDEKYIFGDMLELIEQSLKDEGLEELLQRFQGILKDRGLAADLGGPNKLEI